VSPQTTVVIRFDDAAHLSGATPDWFRVVGEHSGIRQGEVRVADDLRTIIFRPDEPFLRGERVDVEVLRPGASAFSFQFVVAEHSLTRDEIPAVVPPDPCVPAALKTADAIETTDSVLNGVAVPSDYPHVRVDANVEPEDGLIFLTNREAGTPYIMILDHQTTPRFYKKVPYSGRDFKVQPTGLLTYGVSSLGEYYAMDSSYAVIDTFRCAHGFGTDEHELQMLPNRHVLMIALDWQVIDMSQIVAGGSYTATVVGNHVQELDTQGNVVFEWRSWDNYDITDAIGIDLRATYIDYVHMNAIEIDEDGNILVSARHLSEVTKINRTTGQMIWRLGGKKNQFTFLNDPDQISYQHDARALPGERYTIFDNGNFHVPQYSRAVEYQVDSTAKTVERVWQFRRSPDAYTWWMGNAQRLPGGNTLIGWADKSLPKIMEVRPDGSVMYQLDFVTKDHCYRAFKFPWKGQAKAPQLFVEPHNDQITLLYNLFGDRPVQKYYVYAGTSPHPTTRIDSSTGPRIRLTELEEGETYYFRVTAADSTGWESEFSNEESLLIRFIRPGETMVLNGDFAKGTTGWELTTRDAGTATGAVTVDGEYFLAIGNGGSEIFSVQLQQAPFELIQGRRYIVAFNARSPASRLMEVKLEKVTSPFINYTKRGLMQTTPIAKRFAFSFLMVDPSDANARLVLNMGQSDVDLYLDNIEVREAVTADEPGDLTLPRAFRVHEPFPNPFNPSTTLRFEIPEAADVRLTVVNVLGERVAGLEIGRKPAGVHDVQFSPGSLASGVYVGRVEATSAVTRDVSHAVIKLLYLK
ncbi:MAG: hypothetical protein H6Q28_1497, partial [Bacteroidetes bacterium]|nr:hypothetical protein [Bacteroidota bacterium]